MHFLDVTELWRIGANREKLKSESKQLGSEGFAKIRVSQCSLVH